VRHQTSESRIEFENIKINHVVSCRLLVSCAGSRNTRKYDISSRIKQVFLFILEYINDRGDPVVVDKEC
jgi:hypothetical protein